MGDDSPPELPRDAMSNMTARILAPSVIYVYALLWRVGLLEVKK